MRGRSSKQESKEGMEIDSKLSNSKLKDEPHLSGAYIRSLVKQLTSSRTKDPMNPKDPDCVDGDQSVSAQNLTKFDEGFSETPQNQQPQQPQQHKKQVRRRLHTSRPYQERLLNMAEARREIVTALKFHRAAMKQASEQQQLEQQQKKQSQPLQLTPQPCFEQEGKIKSRRNPRIYPSNTSNFSNYLDNLSYSSFSGCPPPPPSPYSWPVSQVPPQPFPETLNFTLPNQTLGLNLNLHDFNNLDTSLYHSSNNPSIYSSASPSSSSSPTLSFATEELPSVAISHDVGGPSAVSDVFEFCGTGTGLHPAMDDERMAEIRSIGEQHQIEWNDTMNFMTSAWWFKFLKTMELEPEEMKTEDDGFHPFDEVMEFPSWLNANESCLQHLSDNYTDDYLQDPALPRMDIGEFEGMDSEWLS
ncbi:hypothetical protein Patl1_13727 [Pistacia atlantica]|uniref:Uncharacterized protein n=1 Tax=Pistacia atlantica TaxID=434234 RepID=A0ACC1ASB2_9ROSI|nr:hypothetical protein Patl1_13727 [Pistacia atlantica]